MRRLVIVLVWVGIFGGYALGQSGAGLGSISGVVMDASKAAVPDAMVVVANESKGIRRVLETNTQGVFTAAALIPAEGYSVTVTKQGFAYVFDRVSGTPVWPIEERPVHFVPARRVRDQHRKAGEHDERAEDGYGDAAASTADVEDARAAARSRL